MPKGCADDRTVVLARANWDVWAERVVRRQRGSKVAGVVAGTVAAAASVIALARLDTPPTPLVVVVAVPMSWAAWTWAFAAAVRHGVQRASTVEIGRAVKALTTMRATAEDCANLLVRRAVQLGPEIVVAEVDESCPEVVLRREVLLEGDELRALARRRTLAAAFGLS